MSGKALILPPFYAGGKLGSESLNNVHNRVRGKPEHEQKIFKFLVHALSSKTHYI